MIPGRLTFSAILYGYFSSPVRIVKRFQFEKKLNLFFINKLGVRRHGRFWYDKETPNAWFNANR